MSDEALRERLKAVREATGLRQQDFAAAADGAARALLGDEAPRYTQTRVSDLERGGRYVALEDIAVYAALDPLRRGKLWLGWDEPEQGMITDEEIARLRAERDAAVAESARLRSAAGGRRRPGRRPGPK